MRLIFMIFAFLAMLVMAAGFVYTFKAQRAKRWPTVRGTVVRGPRVKLVEEDEDGKHYTILIRYRYTVDGIDHTSGRVRVIEHDTGFRRHAQQLLKQVESLVDDGKHVTVYYNPRIPSQSLLIPGASALTSSFFIIGGAIASLGCLWVAANME